MSKSNIIIQSDVNTGKSRSKRIVILRYPCLPEDEGRTHLMRICESREDAEHWIKEYCADGYFSRGNFGVVEEPFHV
jgi:hypothetical protein